MGILNCTPDSFFDGGRFFSLDDALERGLQMVLEGADIIDIGGESTRPFSNPVSEEEELRRVIPLITHLKKECSIPLSIDTSKPAVASKALASGATFINDIYGFENPSMRSIARESGGPICVMHMQGNPATMQIAPSYPQGVILDLIDWFKKRINELLDAQIKPEQIILDPGIGFGKSPEQNLEILRNIHLLKNLGFPILIGLSRKSFMQKILQKQPQELLSTTLALNTMCILEGASIIRVHDIKEHRSVIDILASI